jgi:N-acyl homoserine lactone hydrolase
MKRDRWIVMLAAAAWALGGPAAAQTGTIERLYVLECGQGQVGDLSRWSPGVNVRAGRQG